MGDVIIPVGVSSGGASSRDLTATPFEVLDGYAFVGSAKRKENGVITSKGAETFTPGRNPITIPSGRYLSGDQTIKGDRNLLASNIRKGVTIFGVTGTYNPPLRLGVTAADHYLVNIAWVDRHQGPDETLGPTWGYQENGIWFMPRDESSDWGYIDQWWANCYIAFTPLIDFSQYSTITVTGNMNDVSGAFDTQYNNYIGPQITYNWRDYRFITHQQYASANRFTATFDISSENTSGYLLLVVAMTDTNHVVYEWPGRKFVITSVTLT